MQSVFSKLSLSLVVTSTLMMTGCQSLKPVENIAPTPITPSLKTPENEFALQGKIGVKTPKQSGSAFFTWQQQQEDFEIELSGILGVGKTQISGSSGQITLNSAKTGLISADTPEELLERATGWQAPITHLVDWVQAHPATAEAQVSRDEQQRPQQILEDGWTVNLTYNDNAILPNKLIVKQARESSQEKRITMIIQNR